METQNQNETTPTDETSFNKGKELEHEFAKFMKENLGWNNVRVGAHLVGRSNRKGASVDIIAWRLNETGLNLKGLGKIYLWGCGIFFLLGLLIGFASDWEIEFAEFLIIVSLPLEILGLIVYFIGLKYLNESVLVECKNLKSKVNITHIDKSLRELRDYKSTGDSEYKFVYHYFVSSSGYIETALKYAIENGIVCYHKIGNKFEQTKYYN